MEKQLESFGWIKPTQDKLKGLYSTRGFWHKGSIKRVGIVDAWCCQFIEI